MTQGAKNLTAAAGLAPDSAEGERRAGAPLCQGEMCRRSRGLWVIRGHGVKLARSNSKRRKQEQEPFKIQNCISNKENITLNEIHDFSQKKYY